MCDKAVENNTHALEFVSKCYKADKSVIKLLMLILLQLNMFLIDSRLKKCVIKSLISILLCLTFRQYKTLEMCDKIISDDPFRLKHCHDKYKTQEMCNKAVDDFLLALKFVPGWFVTSKMIKNLLNALYADHNILHFNEDSGDTVSSYNQMGILSKNLNNIVLDYANYDEDDPETIIHIRFLA